ncbi:MAG: dienelactone hydrolase family protein [Acidobacteriaceae bacterium]|nr:dienelactone hydrolase family protein [Acidobacteriaceae bacterium]
MRRLLSTAIVVLAALGTSAHAQDWAKAALDKSPRHGEFVTITEPSGRKLQAWVVYPEVKDKAPVVVMIHEIFGLSDWAREMADEVAGAGYIVVEPDMLSGYGPAAVVGAAPAAAPVPAAGAPAPAEDHAHMHGAAGMALAPATPGGSAAFPDVDSARRGVAALSVEGVMADLNAAADYGKKLSAASGKLYVAGFCWGGQQTFEFATRRKDLAASFVFYGPPPTVEGDEEHYGAGVWVLCGQ